MLVQFQDDNRNFQLMQNSWASQLNPMLSRPANQSLLLKGVVLAIGTNTINHLLGRQLQGWSVVMKNALANIYDAQATNQMSDKTLILISDAVVTVTLEVF